jgi:uncharacterized protein (DUF1778 family)
MTKMRNKRPVPGATVLALSEQQVILLEPEDWDEFIRMLNEPAEPSPALKALMARKPPWKEPGEEPEGSP